MLDLIIGVFSADVQFSLFVVVLSGLGLIGFALLRNLYKYFKIISDFYKGKRTKLKAYHFISGFVDLYFVVIFPQVIYHVVSLIFS
ncbi:hypothetical protein A73_58 [Escherichia phage A73]|uniref:Uncharacterized protein n=2 Tax=Vequintavirinae TaxID=1911928 RepID=A0AAE9VX77_9CAUD|nr:hypothetical protein A54_42 [Escherichia phage A5-4]WBF77632.1 hypothetical protein A73_58 [Escherichia phage A73]